MCFPNKKIVSDSELHVYWHAGFHSVTLKYFYCMAEMKILEVPYRGKKVGVNINIAYSRSTLFEVLSNLINDILTTFKIPVCF